MGKPVEILSMPEAARRLGMRTADVIRLAFDGRIDFVTVDGVWHVADTVIGEYLAEHRQAS